MKNASLTPFGLLFEEHPIATDFIIPIYDEDEDISIIVDEGGHKKPYVEYFRNSGTKTLTKVANESIDEDRDSLKMGGTRTLTAVKSDDSSDSDEVAISLMLGTKTATFVQSEEADTDPGIDVVPKPPLTTRTVTAVAREDTDKD